MNIVSKSVILNTVCHITSFYSQYHARYTIFELLSAHYPIRAHTWSFMDCLHYVTFGVPINMGESSKFPKS